MTKHTKGPWRISRHAGERYYISPADGHGCIAAVQGKANADLVMAAPDLLAACRVAFNAITTGGERLERALDVLTAAIAKATKE